MLPSPPAPAPVSGVPVDQPLTGTPTPPPPTTRPACRPGPRLHTEERAILRELLVRYHDIRTVQTLLRDEYPDLPAVSDRYLRELRAKLLTGPPEDLRHALRDVQLEAFGHGLAVRAHRVLELTRTHGLLLQREGAATEPLQQTAITRERRAILAQIAREVGDLDRLARPVPADPAHHHVAPTEALPTAGSEALADLVQLVSAKLWAAESTGPVDFSAYGPALGDALTELQRLLTQRAVSSPVLAAEVPQ